MKNIKYTARRIRKKKLCQSNKGFFSSLTKTSEESWRLLEMVYCNKNNKDEETEKNNLDLLENYFTTFK